MGLVEDRKAREDLTRKIIVEQITKADDDGLSAAMLGETTYHIVLDGKTVMSISEQSGRVSLKERYSFLPEYLRGLTDRLREASYRVKEDLN